MEAVSQSVALLFLLFVVLGVYATVKVVGAAKRGVDRTISQARRTVEDTTLRAKTYAQPGPAGELAQLGSSCVRRCVPRRTRCTRAWREDASLKESLGLFERLSAHGHELDDELKRLESRARPGDARRATAGPARAHRRRSRTSADSLRWAARDRATRFAGDDLDALSDADRRRGGRPAALDDRGARRPPRHPRRLTRPCPPLRRRGPRPRPLMAPGRSRPGRTAPRRAGPPNRPGRPSPRRSSSPSTPGRRHAPSREHDVIRRADSGPVAGERGGLPPTSSRQVTSSSCPAMSRSSPIQRPTCRRGRWSATASSRCR